MNRRVLLTVDDSHAAVRAAAHVGCMLADHGSARVGLLTILPPSPASVIEPDEYLVTGGLTVWVVE